MDGNPLTGDLLLLRRALGSKWSLVVTTDDRVAIRSPLGEMTLLSVSSSEVRIMCRLARKLEAIRQVVNGAMSDE